MKAKKGVNRGCNMAWREDLCVDGRLCGIGLDDSAAPLKEHRCLDS
jgi:hypothetical protein